MCAQRGDSRPGDGQADGKGTGQASRRGGGRSRWPLWALAGAVGTSGIVSALDRTIEVPADGDSSALLVSAVQTDAAINPGNSGGALVNCAGELVGIPSAGATVPTAGGESAGGSIGLGFAIPVDAAKAIAGVVANGPAATAGLRTGDVITTVAGQPATSNVQLQEQTLTKNPGDTVEVGYLRGGKQQNVTVTLAAQP